MAALNMSNGEPQRTKMNDLNKVTVVMGAQFGDEGKGKVVDMLATSADIVCRCQASISKGIGPTVERIYVDLLSMPHCQHGLQCYKSPVSL